MIIAFDIPKGAKVTVKNGRVFVFLNDESKTDLWKASVHTWLTEGQTVKDFGKNELLSAIRIDVTKKNKLQSQKVK